MYVPKQFEMGDEALRQLLMQHGAGELITYSERVGISATLIPFVYEPCSEGYGSLHGHLARTNDQWRDPPTGNALVLLRGPDAYVTPTWYATKREHGRVVPTWNYVTAHIYGRLIVRDDVEYVRGVVESLTSKHEGGRDPGWAVTDAPPQYIEGQLRAIVGVELQISRIEAKAKLSQNRSAADVQGVITGLAADGENAMSLAMEKAAHDGG